MLETKRKEVELMRVRAARAELEFRILEREEEIKRMSDQIEIQIKKEAELEAELLAKRGTN